MATKTTKTAVTKAATPKVDVAAAAATSPPVVTPVHTTSDTYPPMGTETGPSGAEPIKKAEFLDRAVARSQIKKKDAKPAIEAAMAEMAEILMSGGELVVPPLGKIKMVKGKALDGGAQMLTLKLRTMKLDKTPKENTGVAEDGDDS